LLIVESGVKQHKLTKIIYCLLLKVALNNIN